MKNLIIVLASLNFIMLSFVSQSQSLTWTGAIDNDFYNEQNWTVTGSENTPSDGSLVQGQAIAFELILEGASLDLGEDVLVFGSANEGISLSSSVVSFGSVSVGRITVSDTSTLILTSSEPLLQSSSIDLQDAYSWVKLTNVDPFITDSVYLDHMSSGSDALVHDENAVVNQYYFQGSLIRLIDEDFQALTLYDGSGLSGDSKGIEPLTVYSRSELGDFDNKASSFRLERGYQLCVAIFQNGKSISQVFIANEEALEFDLPQALNNTVSFVRVTPWNWVTKKGASGFDKDLGHTWVYNWSNQSDSRLNLEYAPMSWGGGGATAAAVQNYIDKKRVTHVLGFNESDNCNGQSGQYGGLCQIDVAVPTFANLQSSGLRLVSPSPRENGPFTWLKDFRDAAQETNVRYDVLGVHWYDWGANPQNTPFEDPQKVFDRFKNYLDRVYAEHQMPIWITEFNANANRDSSVHIGFMKLALPYLETLHFVERYDYFSVNPEVAGNREDIGFGELFNEDGSLSLLGEIFKNHQSTPSIPEATWAAPNFLNYVDKKIPVSIQLDTTSIAEGDVLTITVTSDITVGAPQSMKLVISNVDESQYSIREVELTIPEGGSVAETILLATQDDDYEEAQVVTVSLTDLSDNIEWTESPSEFTLTSEDIFVAPLSLNELPSPKIYPNPASDIIYINNQLEVLKSVQLISMDGRSIILSSGQKGSYDLSGIERGVYVLQIISDSGEASKFKVVLK